MTKNITPTHSQMNYTGMAELLGDKASRKVQNNTYLEGRINGDIAVRLHYTHVVRYRSNGEIILDSGGWQTVTTKARMNTWAPVRVMQRNYVWSVCAISDIQGFFDGTERLRHSDGLPMQHDEFYKRSQTVLYVDKMDISDLIREIS